MWNGRFHGHGTPKLNVNNKIGYQSDNNGSIHSISSEDVSAAVEGHCCSAEARNPAIKRGRQLQLLQMIILPFIPILALIVQTSFILHDILIYRMEVSDIETQVS